MKRSFVIVMLVILIFVINSISVAGAPLIIDNGGGGDSGNIAPSITVNTDDIYHQVGSMFYNPSCSVVDNEHGLSCIFDGYVNVNLLGVYTLEVYAIDSQGLRSDSEYIDVVVQDTVAPVIYYQNHLDILEAGYNYVSDIECTAFDLYDGSVDCEIDTSMINRYLIGTQYVILRAEDSSGNLNTILLSVEVFNDRVHSSQIPEYCDAELVGPITPEAMAECERINSYIVKLDDVNGGITQINEQYEVSSTGYLFDTYVEMDSKLTNIYHWEYEHFASDYECDAQNTYYNGDNMCYYKIDRYYVNVDYLREEMINGLFEYLEVVDQPNADRIRGMISSSASNIIFKELMLAVVNAYTFQVVTVGEALTIITPYVPVVNIVYYAINAVLATHSFISWIHDNQVKVVIDDLIEFLESSNSNGEYVVYNKFNTQNTITPSNYTSVVFSEDNVLYRFSFESYTSSYIEVKLDLDSLAGTIYEDVFYALDSFEEHSLYGSVFVEPNEILQYLLDKEIVLFSI